MWPQLVMFTCAIGFTLGLLAYLQRDSQTSIDRLAALGWTVKPSPNDYLFEIAGTALPPMQESSTYFSQLNKPFRLHFQSVSSLDGLHYLADNANCTNIEIGAGEFTDISELRNFSHLTKLAIGQVPLNGNGVVDSAPLSSLVNLQELVLGMTRIRDASFLASLTNLKRLYLGQTLITTIEPISALRSLAYLDIRGTRVTDLSPLSQAQNLEELSVGSAQLSDLAKLSQIEKLARLSVIDQQPIDLANVGSLLNLKSLFVWGGQFQLDLLPIRNLTHLQNLQLSGIGVGPLAPVLNTQAISNLTELRTLTIGYLQVQDLNFAEKLTNLTEINLHQLPITSVAALQNLKSLRKISLSDVPIIDIAGFLELPNLTEVNLIRVPARSDVLSELERRGVTIKRY